MGREKEATTLSTEAKPYPPSGGGEESKQRRPWAGRSKAVLKSKITTRRRENKGGKKKHALKIAGKAHTCTGVAPRNWGERMDTLVLSRN